MPARQGYNEKSHDDYRIGWVCALPCEMAAAICMLDEQHPQLPQPDTDHNNYTFGSIGSHNVVIACLPSGVMGITSAARVATGIRSTFRKLQFGLMVGIGGGAPSEEHDIRLGDVVVSRPEGAFGGVVQYDYGKTIQGGSFVQTGSLNRPPDILLNAMAQVQTRYQLEGSRIPELIRASLTRYPRREAASRYPGEHVDQLFHWMYDHPKPQAISTRSDGSFDWTASLPSQASSCENCDMNQLVRRNPTETSQPSVHYGLVASGNQVMRDGRTRERLRREKGILCFEMEAAGMVDEFPCLIIRGICDYADSHKNKKWQDYAATTAAAYASELLSFVPNSTAYAETGFTSFSYSNQRTVHGGGMYEYRDDQDETIMQSLAFSGMFSRRNNIERRHPQTCTWILEHKCFVDWLGKDHGLLWIKGIPGAGKSTLMAFLHGHFHRHMGSNMVRLDFFFNARGLELQRQFLGLLRSLIHQIFKDDASVRPRVRRLFLEKLSEANGDVQTLVWQQRELESLLCEVTEICAQSRDVLVFVDALDEAGTGYARNIAAFFHRLNECIISQAGSAKFCISSRHYPIVITIPGTEIIVEHYNNPDIEKFIGENLPMAYLLGPNADDSHTWSQLQRDLVLKASGSFQWARLVVPLVEKQITDGKPVLEIYNTLQKVPEALHEAYSHVLQHVIAYEDRPRSLWLFQWACLAQRPLSITELQYAMATTRLYENGTHFKLAQLESFVSSQDQMKRAVRALSGGLVEVIDFQNQAKVETIHKSVNDFLIAGGLAVLATDNPNVPLSSYRPDIVERSHAMMFQTCLDYMQLDGLNVIIQHAQRLRDIQKQLREIEERLIDRSRLLTRKTQHAQDSFFNFHRSVSYRDDDDDSYIRDDTTPIRGYYDSHDGRERRIASEIGANEKQWDHVVASAGDIFEQWPQLDRFVKFQLVEKTYFVPMPKSPQTADLVRNGLAKAAALIDQEAPFLWYALSNLLMHAGKLSAEYFVVNVDKIQHLESILDAWRAGQQLLGNFDSDQRHPNLGTKLLHLAAAANVTSLASYCLGKEIQTTINDVDAGGNTALHLAVSKGHTEMVEILLRARPDVLLRNRDNYTPLATAFRFSCIPAACSIIHYCPRDTKHRRELDRLLGAAVLIGSEELVKLFISAGVDVNARGSNALYKAAKHRRERLVCLLLEAGANVNATADSLGSPLTIACSRGYYEVVKLLLSRRTSINDSELRSGLSRARSGGHHNIVALFSGVGIK